MGGGAPGAAWLTAGSAPLKVIWASWALSSAASSLTGAELRRVTLTALLQPAFRCPVAGAKRSCGCCGQANLHDGVRGQVCVCVCVCVLSVT